MNSSTIQNCGAERGVLKNLMEKECDVSGDSGFAREA
jgi:hypothetical protein